MLNIYWHLNKKSHFQFHPWEKIINGEVVDYDALVEEEDGCCGCCTGWYGSAASLYGQRDFVKVKYFCSSSCRKDEDVILAKNEKRDEKVKKVEDENKDTKVEIELPS